MTDDAFFTDLAISEMVEAGAFGPGCRFSSFELDKRHAEINQFASTVFYGTLCVTTEDGEQPRRRGLVFKLKQQNEMLRAFLKNDLQFHNEILFYERIMPFLSAGVDDDRLPSSATFFYGRNDNGDRDVIVLENVSPRGYEPSAQPLFMDFEHVAIALKSLAKYHGLSYRAKFVDPVRFRETIADIKDTQWNAQGEWLLLSASIRSLIEEALNRLVERRGDDERTRRFRSEMIEDPKRMLWRTMVAAEPLAVLCHGDFNRNNMLFRYEEVDDATELRSRRPVDVLAFDMATVRYGSPAVDLSFFLYMNTDRQLRDDRWDELLDAYCAALSECVSDVVGVRIPDRAELDAEMREHSFYGLTHASFFLRMMTEQHLYLGPDQYVEMTEEEMVQRLLQIGGDQATDLVADVVQHFIDLRR